MFLQTTEINTCLQQIDLRNNDIGPGGGKALAKALSVNVGLRRLDIRWNRIGTSGKRSLQAFPCPIHAYILKYVELTHMLRMV